MEGFVYVIGLSHDIVTKLIDIEYKESGVKGEQYIKKMIQIPIIIPEWNEVDVKTLIKKISNELDEKYSRIVNDNLELITSAVELNPREVKRFINNFIVSHEVYSLNTGIKPKELLAIQTLKMRFNNFYRYFSSSSEFRALSKKFVDMAVLERMKTLKARERDTETPLNEYEIILSQTQPSIWNLLTKEEDTIFGIKDWEIYRRAVELVKEIPLVQRPSETSWIPRARVDSSSLALLQKGMVSEFNKLRKEGIIRSVDFPGVDLHGVKLNKIELHSAQLARSNFDGADLSGANLSGCNLKDASFNGANLSGANLSDALLNYTSFTGAFMTDVIFSDSTYFFDTDFTNATLTKVRFPKTRLDGNTQFTGANVEGAYFGDMYYYPSKETVSVLKKGGAILPPTHLIVDLRLERQQEENERLQENLLDKYGPWSD
jgi:uncharacterized protein YjbI with pentapeptide repeats